MRRKAFRKYIAGFLATTTIIASLTANTAMASASKEVTTEEATEQSAQLQEAVQATDTASTTTPTAVQSQDETDEAGEESAEESSASASSATEDAENSTSTASEGAASGETSDGDTAVTETTTTTTTEITDGTITEETTGTSTESSTETSAEDLTDTSAESSTEADTEETTEAATEEAMEEDTEDLWDECFNDSTTVNDVTIAVHAEAGVFPEDASLRVFRISDLSEYEDDLNQAEDNSEDSRKAVSSSAEKNEKFTYNNDNTIDHDAGSADMAVAQFNTSGNHPDQNTEVVSEEEHAENSDLGFDISIVDSDGNEIQPNGTAKLSFSLPANVDDEEGKTSVEIYHVEDSTPTLMTTEQSTEMSLDVDSFSPYIVRRITMTTRKTVSNTGVWGWSAYYIGESDNNYVTKSSNFNLKYQVEFHSSEDLEKSAVQMTIPMALLNDRDGNPINPSEVAVPKISKDDAENGNYTTTNTETPFNYYVDGDNMVFVNYKEIKTGTNTAFQVLYKNIDVMKIKDGSIWSIQPKIQVQTSDSTTPESQDVDPLAGTIDTTAEITGVTKTRYQKSGSSYTPGLYTKDQVKRFVTTYAAGMSENKIDFDQYKYVVWKVVVEGRSTQPANLTLVDTPTIDWNEATTGEETSGQVVGYSGNQIQPNGTNNNDAVIAENITSTSWKYEFYIVTAYPSQDVESGKTVFKNNLTVTIDPLDQVDEDQTQKTTDQWTYADYHWIYIGDNLYIDKYNSDFQTKEEKSRKTYSSTLSAYKDRLKNGTSDYGSFPYTVHTYFRAYKETHRTITHEMSDGTRVGLGEYIPGTAYEAMVTDDVFYAYPEGQTASWDANRLTGRDYYFNKVTVTRKDTGYDVFEDNTARVETPKMANGTEYVDQTLYVYAKFGTSDEWELAGKAEWDPETGESIYTFTDAQIALEPWQVKAQYRGVNYASDCYINASVCLRGDSEKLKTILKMKTDGSSEITKLQLENVGGIAAKAIKNITPGQNDGETNINVNGDGWLHSQSTENGNYSEEGLKTYTENEYQVLLQRDNAYKDMTDLEKEAKSSKTAKAVNDPNHSRSNVTYTLASYEGYKVYDTATVGNLTNIGVRTPDRTDITYYDLLPYGVKFDASRPVIVGRVTNLSNDYWKNQPRSWNTNQISLSSTPEIINNWKNTGRTMAIFRLHYSGSSSAVFNSGKWFSGFGVSFGAYYDWRDNDAVTANQETKKDFNNSNISAYLPDDSATIPIYGAESDYWQDNGKEKDGSDLDGTYADFAGGDIDGDGNTSETLLYADTYVPKEDIAISMSAGIEKKVRADAQISSSFEKTASVEYEKGYTYELTVTATETQNNIVIFDRLENPYGDLSQNDRSNTEINSLNSESTWRGTLRGVIVRGAVNAGASPLVYACTSYDAAVPTSDTVNMKSYLTEDNGWTLLSELTDEKKKDVIAIAVDLGEKFQLDGGHFVSIQIQMTAPSKDEAREKVYACNNAVLVSGNDKTKEARSVSDATMVSIGSSTELIVEKEIADLDKVPESQRDTVFSFTVMQNDAAYDHKAYTLEEKKADGTWQSADNQLHSTDSDGRLELKAGQRAVFSGLTTATVNQFDVTENENPFWKPERTATSTDAADKSSITKTYYFTNTYQTLIYFNKQLASLPKDDTVQDSVKGTVFWFQVTDKDGNPVKLNYWYVTEKKSGKILPTKDISKGENGEGSTDDKGIFSMTSEDTLVFFGDNVGTKYTFTELESKEPIKVLSSGNVVAEDFYCNTPAATVTTKEDSVSAQITNIYRWRNLILHKNILHQSEEDAKNSTHSFTFQVTDKDGKPLTTENKWAVLDDTENPSTEEGKCGTLDSKGKFTASIAERSVVIYHLVAGEKYTITEVTDENDKDYIPVNGGTVTVTMPKYATSREATITNAYQKRPILVSKQVVITSV